MNTLGLDVSKEEFDKLKTDFENFMALINKSLKSIKDDNEKKATITDLEKVQTNNEKLGELISTFENTFADKETTRKKISNIEKSVSYSS